MKFALSLITLCVFASLLSSVDAESWYVYEGEMPKNWKEHFGDILDKAEKFWEKRIPGTEFIHVQYPEQSHFVVQWASEYQGTVLGYFTPSSNNQLGKPYIAITLGYMDDESVPWQHRKFNLVDVDYALEITKHELGHVLGFGHSEDQNDIMYPSIYQYDDWLFQKNNEMIQENRTKNSKAFLTNVEPIFGFYNYQGETLPDVLEASKEIRIQQREFNDSPTQDNQGTIEFIITNTTDNLIKTSGIHEFSIRKNESELFSLPFTPELGLFILNVETNYLIPNTDSEKQTKTFQVVMEHSKAYSKKNGCDDGFTHVIKPNFSTVVCVTDDTQKTLRDRGWH